MTNEMTAKEAKSILETMHYELSNQLGSDWCRNKYKAIGKAIKALEQQPSEEDFVKHKKEVLERIAKREREIDKYIKELEALEQQPCEDCVSRSELQKTMDSLPLFRFVNNDHEEADDYYNCESVDMVIRNLPSVTPQRPKGKWIDFNWNDGDICRWGIKCSECHTEYKHGGEMWHNPKYCPDCGAEMSGGVEDET